MDTEKLNRWAKVIHDNATAHGWHEEKHSPENWLSLIMCEVAEAIEADRKDEYFLSNRQGPGVIQHETFRMNGLIEKGEINEFIEVFEYYVKGTVNEEFADIVIRLLDMAVELFGKYDFGQPKKIIKPSMNMSFSETAWFFVTSILTFHKDFINEAILFMYEWAGQLGIDLDQHIEWKMKYNESRPYKHGGKKY